MAIPLARGKSNIASIIGKDKRGFIVVNNKLLPASPYKTIQEFGEKVSGKLADNLEKKRKSASGSLNESIKFEIKAFGDYYSFQLSLADYYPFVDKGRKPGKQPPVKEIMKWLKYQSVAAKINTISQHKRGKSVDQMTAKQKKGLAFAIARKIGKKGTKGSNFFSSVVTPALLSKLKKDLEKDFKADVEIEVQNIIKGING